jgi:hypothetical protein
MTEFMFGALLVTLFRIATVLIGFGFAYLGYRLFRSGVYEHATDLKAAWGDKNLMLKQAAPGTLFALFGVVVVATGMYRQISFESTAKSNTNPPTESAPQPITNPRTETTSQPSEQKLSIQGLYLDTEEGKRVLKAYEPLIDRLAAPSMPEKEAIESLYLTTLGRLPKKDELDLMTKYLATAADRKVAYRDLLRTVLSTSEYAFARQYATSKLENYPK